MAKINKMCFDKILPQELVRPQRMMRMANGRLRAIAPKGKEWVNGSTLRIRFLNGNADQIKMVKDIAPEWTRHANLKFEFSDDPQAEIRVTFNENDGAWSYVGTDNLGIPTHAATLNLGWQDQGVILHEFGHMIGLSHEHQSPLGGIEWNEDVVIKDLSGPPNFWNETQIRHNVLNKYSVDQINGTEFDEESIMLYAFPNEWTIGDLETHENEKLSALDKQFIKSASMYPPIDVPKPVVELPVAESVRGEISQAGEEDLYQFVVRKPGVHTIQTMGSIDVVMKLFGPDSETRLVAEDDDDGSGRNSLITADLERGTYFAQVRHYNESRTGNYHILCTAEPGA
ncbi:MAG: hypothetical protein NPINA01_12600 [Nitrospinaceae bacterium]|nr:MAG: hypothetical protein NPINA01_12600 [Nitrospinaceae bacterium]